MFSFSSVTSFVPSRINNRLFIFLFMALLLLGLSMGSSHAVAQAQDTDPRYRGKVVIAHETPQEFTQRIVNAYAAKNQKAAFWDLFYTAGLDKFSLGHLLETIENMSLIAPPVIVQFEALQPGDNAIDRDGTYAYFQNLEPLGAVNIVNRGDKEWERVLRLYYGRHNGYFRLTATVREKDNVIVAPQNAQDSWFFRRERGQSRPQK